MRQMIYCIKHETMELAARVFETIPINRPDGSVDARVIQVGFKHSKNGSWDWCSFDDGWATCPPPKLKPDWNFDVVEPDQAELDLINTNAIELQLDFES